MTKVYYTISRFDSDSQKQKYNTVRIDYCCGYSRELLKLDLNPRSIRIQKYDNELELICEETGHSMSVIKYCINCGTKTDFEQIGDRLAYIKQIFQPRIPDNHLDEETNKWVPDYEYFPDHVKRVLLEILQHEVDYLDSNDYHNDLDSYLNAIKTIHDNISELKNRLK